MAIPPTGFTSLLYEGNTPAEMYERLKTQGCLSADGQAQGTKVIALISGRLKYWEDLSREGAPPICGPGPVDDVANALLGSSFISEKGRRLHQPHLYPEEQKSRRWRFWA